MTNIYNDGWNNLCRNQLDEIKALRDENLRLARQNADLEFAALALASVLLLVLIGVML